MEKTYGLTYVASYLGATKADIGNWSSREDSFPSPGVEVLSTDDRVASRAWTEEQLPLLRAWMADRLDLTLDEAVEHWKKIDDLRARGLPTKVPAPPQKDTLFSVDQVD